MKLKDRIPEILTVAFLRTGDAKLVKKVNYSYGEYSKNMFVYHSKSKEGAQATPWGIIVISDLIFESYSKNVIDLFFLHEYGHTKLHIIPKIIFYIVIIPLYIFFFVSLLSLIPYPIILLLKGNNPVAVATTFLSNLLLSAVLGLLVMGFSWASEAHAEIFAARTMGKTKYLKAIEELKRKEQRKTNLISRIWHRLRYPPHRVIMFFNEKNDVI